jgi:hypothetical protein
MQPDLIQLQRRAFLITLGMMYGCASTHRLNGIGNEAGVITHIVFVRDGARAYPRDDLDVAMHVQAEARVRRKIIVVSYVERVKRRMTFASNIAETKMQPRGEPLTRDRAERLERTMLDREVAPVPTRGRRH